jgi:hypothetical protein
MVSMTDPYGRILGFLDHNSFMLFDIRLCSDNMYSDNEEQNCVTLRTT